ncbi:hypothetical protein [uncultured Roseibium sp.]|uniref:hypothetical protein n=1 Tax=uncultured Roseibium sp. TaxID=1936171 RepID=UPI0026168E78|nr:hypothetical protein [uncultured Roseibium sp.]
MTDTQSKRPVPTFVALFAIVFGLMTVLSGGIVLFGGEAAMEAAGNVVHIVLWFNFLAGFSYVVAGYGLLRQQRWAYWLSIAIFTGTAIVLTGFVLHVMLGGAYEFRTVVAMMFRTIVWAMIARVARGSAMGG